MPALRLRLAGLLLIICCASAVPVGTQGGSAAASRHLTTIDTLRQFPGYFHLQSVVLRGEFVENGRRIALRTERGEISVMLAQGVRTTSGPVELRAELVDVGRLQRGDPRLAGYDVPAESERWPSPGEELLLSVRAVAPAAAATTASVRALALEPWKFEGQQVTLTGQFRGRNLLGDLPSAPRGGRYDFILRGSEGAIWVSGLRPRGKGFDLDVTARVDTGRWLTVTGTVRTDRGLVILDATRIDSATAPAAQADDEDAVGPAAPPPPVEVIFSAPTDAETEVPLAAPVRLQFSRGLEPGSVQGHVTAAYEGGGGGVPPMPIEVRLTYDAAARAVEIRFAAPLESFRTVRISVDTGLKAFDGAPARPFTLRFTTAGS